MKRYIIYLFIYTKYDTLYDLLVARFFQLTPIDNVEFIDDNKEHLFWGRDILESKTWSII